MTDSAPMTAVVGVKIHGKRDILVRRGRDPISTRCFGTCRDFKHVGESNEASRDLVKLLVQEDLDRVRNNMIVVLEAGALQIEHSLP